jgi:hypothetical protein
MGRSDQSYLAGGLVCIDIISHLDISGSSRTATLHPVISLHGSQNISPNSKLTHSYGRCKKMRPIERPNFPRNLPLFEVREARQMCQTPHNLPKKYRAFQHSSCRAHLSRTIWAQRKRQPGPCRPSALSETFSSLPNCAGPIRGLHILLMYKNKLKLWSII